MSARQASWIVRVEADEPGPMSRGDGVKSAGRLRAVLRRTIRDTTRAPNSVHILRGPSGYGSSPEAEGRHPRAQEPGTLDRCRELPQMPTHAAPGSYPRFGPSHRSTSATGIRLRRA